MSSFHSEFIIYHSKLNLGLPGGTIKGSGRIQIVGKKEKRFDSSKICLSARIKFIDMLEETKF
jgi:hypothetical protein